jgi:hypothetical protein
MTKPKPVERFVRQDVVRGSDGVASYDEAPEDEGLPEYGRESLECFKDAC